MKKWKILFWFLIFIDWIPDHPLGIKAEQVDEEKKNYCQSSNGHKWYLENDGWCCPCSRCLYPDLNDEFSIRDCFEDTREDYYCKVEDPRSECIDKYEFSTNIITTGHLSTNVTTREPSVSSGGIHTTVITGETHKPDHFLAITAIATVLILLLLTIVVCKKRKLPLRAKKLIKSCRGNANSSVKKETVSIESGSFISSQNETITEESSAYQESCLSQDITDKSDEKIAEPYTEHPVITEKGDRDDKSDEKLAEAYTELPVITEKGGRGDPNAISLPPDYDEDRLRLNHPSSRYQQQCSNSFSGPSMGYGHQSYPIPFNIPHRSYGGPSHYPTPHGPSINSYPFNAVDPASQRYPNYPNPGPYTPVPPQSMPPGNFTGAVVISNVHIGGSLNISNNGQNPGNANADNPTNASSLANPSASIQPSSFGDTELNKTATCLKPPHESTTDLKVGQRAVHPSLNDYDEIRRRQGNTMESQSDIHMPKYTTRSDQSNRSLASDFGRMRMTTVQDRSFSTQRPSAFSETPVKFFEHSDASNRQLVSLRATAPKNSAVSNTAICDSPNLSCPVQETMDISTALDDTSIENVDIYQSRNAGSDAYLTR